jgi:hypothetical protein
MSLNRKHSKLKSRTKKGSTAGRHVLAVVVASLLFIILDGRDIMMIPTIDNDFSPTESYVVLCPCDKGFRYWRFR